MTPREVVLEALPPCDRTALRGGLDSAIAFGLDRIGIDTETEAMLGAHDLMCRAGESLIDLALVAQVFKAQVRLDHGIPLGDFRTTATLLRDTSAASTRFASRALETHARDIGYSSDAWMRTAFDTTRLFLQDSRHAGHSRVSTMPPLFARIAARSMFDALAASNTDRMAVPGFLADSLGANLALFMHAHAVVGVADARQFR